MRHLPAILRERQMSESHTRTIVRAITYRLTAWLLTILLEWTRTGDLGVATGTATLIHLLLSIDYIVHERIWLKIKWGLKKE